MSRMLYDKLFKGPISQDEAFQWIKCFSYTSVVLLIHIQYINPSVSLISFFGLLIHDVVG